MSEHNLTEKQKSILKQCLWDLNLTPEEFLAIIEGRLHKKWPDKAFCVARLLESVHWFEIIDIFSPEFLCLLWDNNVKNKVKFKEIREGMDFVCRVLQKNNLSPSG